MMYAFVEIAKGGRNSRIQTLKYTHQLQVTAETPRAQRYVFAFR
jgi:hypothetical protein